MTHQPFMIDAATDEGRQAQMQKLLNVLNAPLGQDRPSWWSPFARARWHRDQQTLVRAKLYALVAANQYAFANLVNHQIILGKQMESLEEVRNGFLLLHRQVQEIQSASGTSTTVLN